MKTPTGLHKLAEIVEMQLVSIGYVAHYLVSLHWLGGALRSKLNGLAMLNDPVTGLIQSMTIVNRLCL